MGSIAVICLLLWGELMVTDSLIRKAISDDAPSLARVHIDSWRTTYKGIVQNDFLEAMSYGNSETRWRDRIVNNQSQYALFVAEDDSGRIVGFADGGADRSGGTLYDGELYSIYLLQDSQRKGIGKQLFRHVVMHLKANHFNGMLVWVLAENPSRYFYESLGGQLVREADIKIGGQQLKECAYGWHSLERLEDELLN